VTSGFSFALEGWVASSGPAVLNGNVIGGALISLGALFASRQLQRQPLKPLTGLYRWASRGLFGWGIVWWLGTGIMEIDDRLSDTTELHALLLFITFTAVVFAWLGRARDWPMARLVTFLYLPGLILTGLLYFDNTGHFLYGLGWLGWPLAIATQTGVLWLLDKGEQAATAPADAEGHVYVELLLAREFTGAWHIVTLLLLSLWLALEVSWQVDVRTGGDWNLAAAAAMPAILARLVWRCSAAPRWPVPAHPAAYLDSSLLLVGGLAVYLTWLCIDTPGDSGGMRYIPVANPLDLATLLFIYSAWSSFGACRRFSPASVPAGGLMVYRLLIGMAVFVLTTLALVRGVHHYTGLDWNVHTLFDSVRVQAALSVYWGVLGFAGMIGGARRAHRVMWLAGAGLMGLVVVKLFAVDLGNSGTVERIISFIATGILLLVVGYFAPAPPRQGSRPLPLASD